MNRIFYSIGFLFLAFFYAKTLEAQQTVGLFTHTTGSEDDGYVLFAPVRACDTTYLIDKCGRVVHQWRSDRAPGLDVYLLPDGTLLRSGDYPNPVFNVLGSAGGVIQRYDWNSNLVWQYVLSDSLQTQNHDICYMPNGNILAVVWEVISDSEAIANGRKPSLLGTSLWSAKVMEIRPVGTDSADIVWTWRLWDHMVQDFDSTKLNYGVVADHPELMNLNYVNTAATTATNPDWLHFNAVTYNEALDQVMLSFHNTNEIYIVDHATDSATAATHSGGAHGKGGDFLYRWGNPLAYNRGTIFTMKLFQQHNPEWIKTGKYANQIMIFNNGNGRPGTDYSSVDIIDPPIDSSGNYTIGAGVAFGPDTLSWTYFYNVPPNRFFTPFMGGSQALPGGGTLICEAQSGRLFEIDSAKNVVWDYINPVDNGVAVAQESTVAQNAVYRCLFYQSTYSGFAGHTLAPGARIEINPLPDVCGLVTTQLSFINAPATRVYPNPAKGEVMAATEDRSEFSMSITDMLGRIIATGQSASGMATISTASIPSGLYIVKLTSANGGELATKLAVQH